MRKGFLTVMCLVFVFVGRVHAYDDGDFQVWHTENQEFKVNANSRITLEEEFCWGDNASDFYYHHYDAGLVYSLNSHFDLGMNYQQVYEKKKGDFKEENRPHLNGVLKYDFWGWKLEERSRFEFRNFDYQPDSWRYRNKFTLKLPWKLTALEIQPYAADELFLDLNDGTLSRNRMYCGFGFALTKSLKGEIYYLLQTTNSSGKWSDANVLGSKLKISF